MKELFAAGIALAAAAFASAAGDSTSPLADNGGIIAVSAIDAVAVVLKADPESRTVTIKDPKGREVRIDIPPQLPLDQIQQGALLDVRYVEAEALTIAKAGVPVTEIVQSVVIAPQMGTRDALTAKPHRVKGLISRINHRKRELTVLGPDAEPIALKVAPVVEGFDELKAGDTAVIEYTEAVVLSAVKHENDKADATRL